MCLRIIFKNGEVREYKDGEWSNCDISKNGILSVIYKNDIILQAPMENVMLIEKIAEQMKEGE
jgi:hypothetical protein